MCVRSLSLDLLSLSFTLFRFCMVSQHTINRIWMKEASSIIRCICVRLCVRETKATSSNVIGSPFNENEMKTRNSQAVELFSFVHLDIQYRFNRAPFKYLTFRASVFTSTQSSVGKILFCLLIKCVLNFVYSFNYTDFSLGGFFNSNCFFSRFFLTFSVYGSFNVVLLVFVIFFLNIYTFL